MRRIARHLTATNAISLVAIVAALTAGAYAAGLERNSVKSKQIKAGAVKTRDLADGGVTAAKLADGAVGSSKLADGAVNTAKIADGAVNAAKIADGSVAGADVADDSLTATDIVETSLQGVAPSNSRLVGGVELKKIVYSTPQNGVLSTILDYPGNLQITASCTSAGGLDLTAFTGVNGSTIMQTGIAMLAPTDLDGTRSVASNGDLSFDTNETFQIDNSNNDPASLPPPGGTGSHQVSILFTTPTGFTARVEIQMFFANPCVVTGIAVAR